ncbi:MAG: c-type cytochrome biogenesis protein CcmI, partial [Gammaproteobacteria bacterium]
MITFFIAAALLLLITAIMLIFWPVFRAGRQQAKALARDNVAIFKERLGELDQEKKQGYLDESGYKHLKLELEKNLLNDVESRPESGALASDRQNRHWLTAVLLSITLLAVSVFLYLQLGRAGDYLRYQVMQEQDGGNPEHQMADFKSMIEGLRAKLTEKPEDLPKWYLLAKSYLSIGEYDKAVDTFVRMSRFVPKEHPDYAALKGHYAQALYLAAGEKMTPGVIAETDAALALDPKETSALTLKGIQAFDLRDYRQAIDYWQQAEQKAAPEQIERFLQPAIANASEKLGLVPSESQ